MSSPLFIPVYISATYRKFMFSNLTVNRTAFNIIRKKA